ncbi:MAG: phosphatase PAP2 family protein [Candidatus Thorarchaeota archaeon]|nr:MAG: phosphatase PAP2 family protein [Candidatus Thorarchaeota archaeon]
MLSDPNITLFLRNLLPWAGGFFKIISEVGDIPFYVAIIFVAYWTFGKREAILTSLVMVASVFVNYWLKYFIANPRPSNTPPNNYWYEGVEAINFGTPSGHAQSSATFYGWLSGKLRKWWMLLLSTVLVFLIGISRVYLGVHYLGNVLPGWGIGIVLVLVTLQLESQLTSFAARYKSEYLRLALFVFGFIVTFASSFLPFPPGDNFGAYGGMIMGLGIAVPLEQGFVDFESVSHFRSTIAVVGVVVGVMLVLGAMLGLSQFLPTAEIWLRTLRYFIVVVLGIFIWPLIFKKVGL